MISLTPTGSPAETAAAYTLLAIIADPEAAKARLDALVAEKNMSLEAMESARKLTEETKALRADVTAKAAAAQKLTDDFNASHEVRTKSLDERDALLVAKDARLSKYEDQVAAHEKEVTGTLDARDTAIKAREVDVTKREAALRVNEAATQDLKEAYQRKVDAFRAMQEELK